MERPDNGLESINKYRLPLMQKGPAYFISFCFWHPGKGADDR